MAFFNFMICISDLHQSSSTESLWAEALDDDLFITPKFGIRLNACIGAL